MSSATAIYSRSQRVVCPREAQPCLWRRLRLAPGPARSGALDLGDVAVVDRGLEDVEHARETRGDLVLHRLHVHGERRGLVHLILELRLLAVRCLDRELDAPEAARRLG